MGGQLQAPSSELLGLPHHSSEAQRFQISPALCAQLLGAFPPGTANQSPPCPVWLAVCLPQFRAASKGLILPGPASSHASILQTGRLCAAGPLLAAL